MRATQFGIGAIAIGLGIATVAFCTWVFLDRLTNPYATDSGVLVRRGTGVWNYCAAETVGIRWRNAEQTTSLRVPRENLGGSEGDWSDESTSGLCELAESPIRTGALAVGWPTPWILWRFSADSALQSFPPWPETADSVESLKRAVARVLAGEGRVTMTGRTAWAGAFATTLSSVAWWIIVQALVRAHRGRRATRRAELE